MIIRDFALKVTGDARITSATVTWEDHDFPEQSLFFEIADTEGESPHDRDEPCADAFLAGCFPLAAVHGEARICIEAQPCPMLIDGLRTVHAWWESWGGMPSAAPVIESSAANRPTNPVGPRRAMCCLSGELTASTC
jgi:hypothetical protein